MYAECIGKLQGATKDPTHFLEPNENVCYRIRDNLKKLYDFAKNEEIKTVKSNALQELIIQNFDLEQIWQQIELQNSSVAGPLLTVVSKLVVGKLGLLFGDQTSHVSEEGNIDKKSEDEYDETNSEESNSDEVEDAVADESGDEEVNLEDVESNESDERVRNKTDRKIKPSVLDDKFFKLTEMETFLEAEEKKLNDPDSGNDSDDQSESEASVDLFKNDISDDSDYDVDDKLKTAKYKDFFGTTRTAAPREITSDVEEDQEHSQSSFDLRQSRLGKKIQKIEEEAVKDKSWQLKGEVTAENRPQNSLLEEIVEFDLTTRPAPVMTEQTTMQLEDIIKQRIKDKTFDSVERKIKLVETPFEYKKKLVLAQEKSKESLAQIYEKEFLEQQASFDTDGAEKEEKGNQLHQEINLMMRNLLVKLDALSNFHFTPKPAVPELKIVSNLPAVSMEEVAPVATSDAALLAPEEIKAKTIGDLVGKNERTVTDKKRERRKKKLKQKIHVKEKQKKEHASNKMRKKGSQSLKKRKKIDKINESAESAGIKSSKVFFAQLQQQAQSHIKRKSFGQQSERDGNISSAKRLKL